VIGRIYEFPENESNIGWIRLDGVDGGDLTLTVLRDGVEQRLTCAYGDWRENRVSPGGTPAQRAAVSGAWVEDDVYVAKILFHETPHHLTVRMRFNDEQVFLDSEYNVTFGPTKLPQLVGKAK
jgi:hypothetical protein